jgi:phosphate transport system permease protein
MSSAASFPSRLERVPTPWRKCARSDAGYRLLAWTAGGIGTLIPLAIVGFLAWHGIEAATPAFVFGLPAGSGLDGKGGIWPAVAGSLSLVGLGLVLALALGVGGALYLAEFNRSLHVERIARFCVESLAAVPGLVYGMFGFAFLVVGLQLKISLLSGAITLGILMLPLVLVGAHEAFRGVDPALREAAHALGVSHAYAIRKVVWPAARPAILTATALAMVHALGAAAPLLFTAATVFTKEAVGLTRPVMTLPTHLYYVTSEIGATPYAYATALVLAGVVVLAASATLLLRRRRLS